MTEAAAAAVEQGKEADHHPYFRPKDAATLILVDRSHDTPEFLCAGPVSGLLDRIEERTHGAPDVAVTPEDDSVAVFDSHD